MAKPPGWKDPPRSLAETAISQSPQHRAATPAPEAAPLVEQVLRQADALPRVAPAGPAGPPLAALIGDRPPPLPARPSPANLVQAVHDAHAARPAGPGPRPTDQPSLAETMLQQRPTAPRAPPATAAPPLVAQLPRDPAPRPAPPPPATSLVQEAEAPEAVVRRRTRRWAPPAVIALALLGFALMLDAWMRVR